MSRPWREDQQRAREAANAFPVHRPADVGAAPETQPGQGEEGSRPPCSSQQELLERHWKTRYVPSLSALFLAKILTAKSQTNTSLKLAENIKRKESFCKTCEAKKS